MAASISASVMYVALVGSYVAASLADSGPSVGVVNPPCCADATDTRIMRRAATAANVLISSLLLRVWT
jgi:hypothetical protein